MVRAFHLCNILFASAAMSALTFPAFGQDLSPYIHRGEDAVFDANGRLRSEPVEVQPLRLRPAGIPRDVTAKAEAMLQDGRLLYGPRAPSGAINIIVSPGEGAYVLAALPDGSLSAPVEVLEAEATLYDGVTPASIVIDRLAAFGVGVLDAPSDLQPADYAALRFGPTLVTVEGVRLTRENARYLSNDILRWISATTQLYRPPAPGARQQVAGAN